MADILDRAREMYVNQRTGEWYESGDDESKIAKDLVAEVEVLRTAVYEARKALNSGYNNRALKVLDDVTARGSASS